jgi:uncharacterized protein (TIGR00299 family) protein
MMVAAFLDAGADAAAVVEAMSTPANVLPGCTEIEVSVADTLRGGLHAKNVRVLVQEEHRHRPPGELLEAASVCLQRLRISKQAGEFVMDALGALISAEAAVHGEPTEAVQLHETGSGDTLADVLGAAVALDDLGVFADTAVYTTPVAVGGGTFHFSHGAVSSPAPATLEILRAHGIPSVGGPVDTELATPTGVALLAALAPKHARFYPPMNAEHVGYGAGIRDFAEMPNVLRVVLGTPIDHGLASDEVWIIETNIDDATGETIGHAMQQVLKAGARDVVAIPVFAKKGRPGHILQALADAEDVERLCSALIVETGSIGVRILPAERRILHRESVPIALDIGGTTHSVSVKVARDNEGTIVRVKAEYEDICRVAELAALPFREVDALATRKAAEFLR